ncbi:MAG: hypothetical protein AAGF75_14030, partial [Cyanobacteria bacterium P01_H01_bin.130]
MLGCTPTPQAKSPPSSSPVEPHSNAPTRTVIHAMGATEVPTTPKRVVMLDTAPLDAAIAL